jgi:CRP-like cAMP-binding protein
VSAIQHKVNDLLEVLPFRAERDLLQEIIFSSSQIEFCGVGEKLFKRGDKPLGFYWILEGRVEIVVPEKALIDLGPGFMAGLDCFLNKELHPFHIVTASANVSTLFIDERCFEAFRNKPHFRRLINKQVLYHLGSYKRLLYSPTQVLLKK